MNDDQRSEKQKALEDAVKVTQDKRDKYNEVKAENQSAWDNKKNHPIQPSIYDKLTKAQAELEEAEAAVEKIVSGNR